MRYNQVMNVTYLKDRRKALRNELTPAEVRLWSVLKNGSLKQRKFRRQHGIANYIVDFYCAAEKLIVELDGQVHNDPMQAEYDAERDTRLRAMGNTVLRFENSLVFTDMEDVLAEIERHFKQA